MKKYWKWVRLVGLIVFSGGWLWPLYKFAQYIGVFSIDELARRVAPEKYGPYVPSDFPYVQYLETTLQVACLWIAVVIIFWAVVVVRLSVQKKRAALETSG